MLEVPKVLCYANTFLANWQSFGHRRDVNYVMPYRFAQLVYFCASCRARVDLFIDRARVVPAHESK